jgi:hypothetical protein
MAFAPPQIRAYPSAWVPNRAFTGFPNWKISEIRAANSWDSGLPHVHDSTSSPNRVSRTLHACELETSQVSEFLHSRISCPWKTYFENTIRLRRFEGDVFSWIPQQNSNIVLVMTPPTLDSTSTFPMSWNNSLWPKRNKTGANLNAIYFSRKYYCL